jgi:hypothetical protein
MNCKKCNIKLVEHDNYAKLEKGWCLKCENKDYEKRKKQKIEKIRKFFLEKATKGQQTEMAAAIYHYIDEYGSCDFLEKVLKR